MLANLTLTLLALAGSPAAAGSAPLDIRVDSARREIVLTVGPLHIPAATSYDHHHKDEYVSFQWPVPGWLTGYRVDLIDAGGRTLPREMLHHAGMANLSRRQTVYPVAERVFAAARETMPVRLPEASGLPVRPGARMVIYYALVNPTDTDVHDALLRVVLPWTPPGGRSPTSLLPFYASARAVPGEPVSFDIPAGVSSTSSEFTLPTGGRLRALGGHLHDYGVEIRLEDAETGRILARLTGQRDRDGRLLSVNRTVFLSQPRGLRLHANHRYRVVAVYDNPTGRTIPGGAMGVIAGAFIPDHIESWSAPDPTDPVFQQDMAKLLGAHSQSQTSARRHTHH